MRCIIKGPKPLRQRYVELITKEDFTPRDYTVHDTSMYSMLAIKLAARLQGD